MFSMGLFVAVQFHPNQADLRKEIYEETFFVGEFWAMDLKK